MKKILIVFGTRPEAIKMAPLYLEFKNSALFETYLCVTSQHKEMLKQVLDTFDITPDFDIDVMKKNQDLFDITSKILIRMKKIINDVSPDIVMVHGDTSTTFAASLACFYLGIKVGHVEAGLRTYDLNAPFPEEFNRQITGKISTYHFAPTKSSYENLINEGVSKDKIWITGNTVIDALYEIRKKIKSDINLRENVLTEIQSQIDLSLIDKKTRY